MHHEIKSTLFNKQWRITLEEETFFSVVENQLPCRIIKTGIDSLGEARKALVQAQRELGGNIDLVIRKETIFK